MIIWYYPSPKLVDYKDRIKIASHIASSVPAIDYSIKDQDRRLQDPRMYNYHLLLWERFERDELQRKFDNIQRKFVDVSKELSKYKKKYGALP